MTSNILESTEGGVAVLRINDPATRNALTAEMLHQLHDAVRRAETTSRAMILRGEGKAFCSGANLAAGLSERAAQADFDAGASLREIINPLMRTLHGLRIPWITAVRGPAAGFGAALALAADLIVAADDAYFLEAFCRIGLVPDGGSTFLLTRAIGRARASEMTLLGERIPAPRALEWGLINRVVADAAVDDEARRLARALADGPTGALGLTRQLVWRATEGTFDDALRAEAEAQREAGRKADFREGVQAFNEKRPPRFTGQ